MGKFSRRWPQQRPLHTGYPVDIAKRQSVFLVTDGPNTITIRVCVRYILVYMNRVKRRVRVRRAFPRPVVSGCPNADCDTPEGARYLFPEHRRECFSTVPFWVSDYSTSGL